MHEVALGRALQPLALAIDHRRLHAEEAAGSPSRASAAMAPGSGVIMMPPVSVCHQVSTIGQRPSPTTR